MQFNAYGGTNWGNFESGASQVAEYVNANNHLTIDVGQVIFSKYATTTMTGDGPSQVNLLPDVKWDELNYYSTMSESLALA